MDKDDEVILLCGNIDRVGGSQTFQCADCGDDIVHLHDPGVPENHVKLCIACGLIRIAESNEVPQFEITPQNEEFLRSRGFKLKTEGSC